MDALYPVITNVGLMALINADNNGLEAQITHVAFGDGNGVGYAPAAAQTALVSERARVAVGGGERVGSFEIMVQALLDAGPAFTIREAGFILDDGKFLAIWSDPALPLAVYTPGVPIVFAYNLALAGIPPGSVNVTITGPAVNISIAGPFAQITAEIIRLQRRIVETENARLIPEIESMWS